jgi:hypothetical protein
MWRNRKASIFYKVSLHSLSPLLGENSQKFGSRANAPDWPFTYFQTVQQTGVYHGTFHTPCPAVPQHERRLPFVPFA